MKVVGGVHEAEFADMHPIVIRETMSSIWLKSPAREGTEICVRKSSVKRVPSPVSAEAAPTTPNAQAASTTPGSRPRVRRPPLPQSPTPEEQEQTASVLASHARLVQDHRELRARHDRLEVAVHGLTVQLTNLILRVDELQAADSDGGGNMCESCGIRPASEMHPNECYMCFREH